MELITKAEYARRRGVTKPAVQKAVATGRIVLIDGKIDPEQADRQWNERTNRKQQRQKSAPGDRSEHKPEERKAVPGETFSQAQTRKEIALADARERDNRIRDHELVEAKDATAEWGRMISSTRAAALLVPDKLAPKIAPVSDVRECRMIIAKEMNALLSELSEYRPHE